MTARRTRSTTSRRRTTTPAARRRTPESQLTGAFNKVVSDHPVWAAVILIVAALAAWLYLRYTEGSSDTGSAAPTSRHANTPSTAASSTAKSPAAKSPPSKGTTASKDPKTGLAVIAESALPEKAKQVLAAIRAGGPFEFSEDGVVFGNYEGVLPKRRGGYYHEYTVKLPSDQTRGAHRLVTGQGGEIYWSEDHYTSFSIVKEGA